MSDDDFRKRFPDALRKLADGPVSSLPNGREVQVLMKGQNIRLPNLHIDADCIHWTAPGRDQSCRLRFQRASETEIRVVADGSDGTMMTAEEAASYIFRCMREYLESRKDGKPPRR